MKAVVIGESSGATMEQVMAVYPRHKTFADGFIARGEVIAMGPFSDRGNMAIFRTREAAERFIREDPFALEGLVKSYTIREWNDSLHLQPAARPRVDSRRSRSSRNSLEYRQCRPHVPCGRGDAASH